MAEYDRLSFLIPAHPQMEQLGMRELDYTEAKQPSVDANGDTVRELGGEENETDAEPLDQTDAATTADDDLPDVTQGYIPQIKELLTRSGDFDQAARRARIEAAVLIIRETEQGTSCADIYAALGFSRKTGAQYAALGRRYLNISTVELERFQAHGKLLSLGQAVALEAAVERAPDEDKQRVIEKVMAECPPPDQIESIVPKTAGDETRLKQRLNIEKKEIEALRKTAPARPTYDAEVKPDRVVVYLSHATLPMLFAAMTKNPAIYLEIAQSLQSGCLIEIRRTL